jgi:hypothetical protein
MVHYYLHCWLAHQGVVFMNERIKQLAEQAGLLGPSSRVGNAHEATEKFAELIIRECLDIAKNWEDQLEKDNLLKESNAVGIVVYRIARQFGVKE